MYALLKLTLSNDKSSVGMGQNRAKYVQSSHKQSWNLYLITAVIWRGGIYDDMTKSHETVRNLAAANGTIGCVKSS